MFFSSIFILQNEYSKTTLMKILRLFPDLIFFLTFEIFNDFRTAEYPYGDKDQSGEFTLQIGDLVEFQVATDRRDKLQRATKIQLCQETFSQNSEKREKVSLLVNKFCSVKAIMHVIT